MVFTKEKVSIFLGSYGDTEKSKHLPLGTRLEIYFKANPLDWRGGMARHSGNNLNMLKNLVILLTGPLCSFFLAATAVWVIYAYNLNDFFKILSLAFLVSAVFDLRNLFPDETPIKLHNGNYTYRDGYQIYRLLKFGKDNELLKTAYELYNKRDFAGAIELFEKINPKYIDIDMFTVIISSYAHNKDYLRGSKFYPEILNRLTDLNSELLFSLGLIESRLGNNDKALDFYSRSIGLNNENIYSLSNRGYTYNLSGRYEQAIIDFDSVIQVEAESSYAFANRGYAKIKLNLMEEGLDDINTAIKINDKEAYAYKALGWYYFEGCKYDEAAKNLQRAYELDPDLHLIEEDIKRVNEMKFMA
jgi:tetratricopeptide (TPR) repeat protein